MAAKKITISQALGTKKQLAARHAELITLRNANSADERHMYGANRDKEVIKAPLYNVVKLDSLITQVSREMRLLDEAIKTANATLFVPDYQWDETVLGEVV